MQNYNAITMQNTIYLDKQFSRLVRKEAICKQTSNVGAF